MSAVDKTVIADLSGNAVTVTGNKLDVNASFAPSGTQDVNITELLGVAVDVNSGNKSAGTQRIVIATDQPQLTNALKVDGSAVTQPVSGTFWQATQPVSGTFWQATQPISAAALPLPTGAATAANQQTNALTDTELRATAVPVSGTFFQATQPVSATNLDIRDLLFATDKVDVSGSTAVGVTGTFWQATQPISATNLDVALSTRLKPADTLAGITTVAAVTAITNALPAGNNILGQVKLTDGTDIADILDLTNSNPLTVAIVDANGDQISSFGGGTQYTEGDTDASITGNAVLMEVAANTLQPIQGTVADGLLVNLGANNDVTVTGSVTANAGTNLNTSALALEAGGNLASIKAKTDNIPALGQALAAASVPVVLTAAQITTLTPPAAITGFATAAAQTDKSQFTKLTDGTDTGLITAAGELNVLATAQPGVDIGDVTINNASGGSAVNVQDGGNSLTVDGTIAFSNTTIAVTNAGTFATQVDGAALTSLQLIDDTVFIDDTSTHSTGSTKGIGIMAVANPTDAAVDANDIGMIAMTTARALKNDITTIAGTAPTTAGFIDIKGADGNVFVRQATASNLNMTEASAASALTSLQLLDDVVATLGTTTYTEATTKANLIGAVRRDADTTLVDTTNEIAPLQVNAAGQLKTSLITAIPAGSNAIGKLAANSGVDIGDIDVLSIVPGTSATNLGKAEDAVHTTGDTGVFTLSVANEAQTTLAADGDYIPRAADIKGNNMIVGNIAHDGVDAGNPMKIGAKAIAHGTNPTSVAAADRTHIYANRAGIPFVLGGHPNIISAEYNTTGAQTDDDILGAIGAGTIVVVTGITVTASNANTVNTSVRIGFGASTLTASGASGATAVSKIILSHPNLAAGSGVVKGNSGGIVGIGGDGEELRITCSAPTTGSLFVQIDYFTIES